MKNHWLKEENKYICSKGGKNQEENKEKYCSDCSERWEKVSAYVPEENILIDINTPCTEFCFDTIVSSWTDCVSPTNNPPILPEIHVTWAGQLSDGYFPQSYTMAQLESVLEKYNKKYDTIFRDVKAFLKFLEKSE